MSKTLADDRVHQGMLGGLTKREYFSALILQGILSNSNLNSPPTTEHTEGAVIIADALIKALNQTK